MKKSWYNKLYLASLWKNGEVLIYVAVAYGVTFLMGLLMWYGSRNNIDLEIFPNAQMFYPAAGVMTAVLCTRKKDSLIPKVFYVFFICVTILMVVVAVLSIVNPYAMIVGKGYAIPVWPLGPELLIIGASVVGWIILLATKKEKRRAYGLCWKNTVSSLVCIFLFFVLYILRAAIAAWCGGEWADFCDLFRDQFTYIQLILLPIVFLLLYIAFFGEEYGWRYYLQPLMQARFGMRGGVLLLGVVWGIWHLPVDLFYYTQDSQLTMIVAQQITCITIGIFLAYAYMKTENIWVPVVLHFLNNNLIPIVSNRHIDYPSGVLTNQTVTWGELLTALVMNGLIFGIFIFAKPFRRAAKQ